MNTVYFSLGSNIGNRQKYLNDALKMIDERIGRILKKSSVYETEPWGKTDQPMFLNMVIAVDTLLSANDVLNEILEIERKLGRIRIEKWSERKIDIDILFYNNEVIVENNLVVPHPYMDERRFVMYPLDEIASDFIHPVLKVSVRDLLITCQDKTRIKKMNIEPAV
jgi:2-amino-4-hydroxy-6-hydroxymethyldihydropteridine diphosphokinase